MPNFRAAKYDDDDDLTAVRTSTLDLVACPYRHLINTFSSLSCPTFKQQTL
jgi:hypothetical protein